VNELLPGLTTAEVRARIADGRVSTQSHTGTMVLLSITSLWVLVLHARPLRGIRLVFLTGMLALCIATFTIAPLSEVLGFTVLELDKLGWVLALAVAANAAVSIVIRAQFRLP